ncbi:hypothetical protein KF913_06035 [Candidatus Obscuribacterales bacterium]|nr:hypothetical protein [Candidatus Obscuribacterales bacterium]
MNSPHSGNANLNVVRFRDFDQRWNGKCFRSFQLDAARRKLTAQTVSSKSDDSGTQLLASFSSYNGLATIFRRNCISKQFAAIYVSDDAIHLWVNNTDFKIDENTHALIAFDSMLGNRFTLYSGLSTLLSVSFHTGFSDLNDYDDWDYEPSFWEYVAEVISDRHQRKTFSYVWSAFAKGKRRPETGCDYANPERLRAVLDPFDTTCDIEEFPPEERPNYLKSAEEDLTHYVETDPDGFKFFRLSSIAIIMILVSIFIGIATGTTFAAPTASDPYTAGDTSPMQAPDHAEGLRAVSSPDGSSSVEN